MKRSLNLGTLFWLPWWLTALFVLRSRPFLTLPYDPWHHLMLIRGWYQDGVPWVTRPGVLSHETGWHFAWSCVFRVLGISDAFWWAKIIHVTQFAWTLFCVSWLTSVCLRIGCPWLGVRTRRLLGLVGAWLFILGAGTYSAGLQQAWIMWYSVGYQGFTLPAFFLVSALLIDVTASLNEDKPLPVWKAGLILPLIALIAIWHPLELAYVVMVWFFVALVFADRLVMLARKRPWAVLAGLLGGFVVLTLPFLGRGLGFDVPIPRGLGHLADARLFVHEVVQKSGWLAATGHHRGPATVSGWAWLGLACSVVMMGLSFREARTHSKDAAFRVSLLVLIVGLFFALAPRMPLLSGFFALMIDPSLVYRLAYASFWFVGLVMLVGWLMRWLRPRVAWPLLFLALVIVWAGSLFTVKPTIARNVTSVWRSLEWFNGNTVGVQYAAEDLLKLDDAVKAALPPPPGKTNLFLVRADLTAYVRAVHGVYVWGDRLNCGRARLFREWEKKEDYVLVQLPLPADFPLDESLKERFKSLRLNTPEADL
jgi:hypothetical protein